MSNFLIKQKNILNHIKIGDIFYNEDNVYDDSYTLPYWSTLKVRSIDQHKITCLVLDVDKDNLYDNIVDNVDNYYDEDYINDLVEDAYNELIYRIFTIDEDLLVKDEFILNSKNLYLKKNLFLSSSLPEEEIPPPKEPLIFLLKRRAGGYTMMIHKKLIDSKLLLKKKIRGLRSRISNFFTKKKKYVLRNNLSTIRQSYTFDIDNISSSRRRRGKAKPKMDLDNLREKMEKANSCTYKSIAYALEPYNRFSYWTVNC